MREQWLRRLLKTALLDYLHGLPSDAGAVVLDYGPGPGHALVRLHRVY